MSWTISLCALLGLCTTNLPAGVVVLSDNLSKVMDTTEIVTTTRWVTASFGTDLNLTPTQREETQ